MAEKRMFTKLIIDSDMFLEMPLSSQALYFHLNMRADDEGFVNNPKKISRLIGAAEDDLKILMQKNFVIGFETGVIVIKHWKMHNTLRSERIKMTSHTEERSRIFLKDNESYTIDYNQGKPLELPLKEQQKQGVSQLADKCQTNVRLDKIRLDKNSVDKIRLDKIYNELSSTIVDGDIVSKTSIIDEFEILYNVYPRKLGKAKALEYYKKYRKTKDSSYQAVLDGLNRYIDYIEREQIDPQFIKHASTWFNQKGWEDTYESKKRKNTETLLEKVNRENEELQQFMGFEDFKTKEFEEE